MPALLTLACLCAGTILESWLEEMIKQHRAPHLVLELHDDGNGRLHISRPPVAGLQRYLDRMKTLEAILAGSHGSVAP